MHSLKARQKPNSAIPLSVHLSISLSATNLNSISRKIPLRQRLSSTKPLWLPVQEMPQEKPVTLHEEKLLWKGQDFPVNLPTASREMSRKPKYTLSKETQPEALQRAVVTDVFRLSSHCGEKCSMSKKPVLTVFTAMINLCL